MQNKYSILKKRLNIVLIVCFVLFALLIFRLVDLQIVNGIEFEGLVKRTDTITATENVPRGQIYDRNGKLLVANKSQPAITYTRGQGISSEDMIEIAQKLSDYIDMPINQVTKRDRQDYFVVMNEDLINDRLTDEEKQLPGSELYQVQLSKVRDDEIKFLEQEDEAIAIFKQMNGAKSLSTTYIKNRDVSPQEIAQVAENVHLFPGVDTDVDWSRTYPEGGMLRSILGSVSSENQGLPSDMADTYLSRGYASNDRVGISYLEKQYESLLQGSKVKSENRINTRGEIVESTDNYAGQNGKNLVLTVDADFQQKVEDIAINYMENISSSNIDRIYILAQNPQSGEILALSGKSRNDKGEVLDDALGTFSAAYGMGSVIKPATVAAGYMHDVISVDDNTLIDEPLVFAGTPAKSSVFNRPGSGQQIPMTDIQALERSSNVYMMKIAMMLGGTRSYSPNDVLRLDPIAYDRLRDSYAQFGLGTKTGLDLPGEIVGFDGGQGDGLAKALDLAYGQFDTYTPIQVLQYISTIANNGTRVTPHLLKEVRSTNEDGQLGSLESIYKPTVLNQVQIEDEEMARIQEGLYAVTHGDYGTARTMADATYKPAGKTGTVEAFFEGEAVTNGVFGGYAPFDNPEIAITVVIPYANDNDAYASTNIARQVFDAYFIGPAKNEEPVEDQTSLGIENLNNEEFLAEPRQEVDEVQNQEALIN